MATLQLTYDSVRLEAAMKKSYRIPQIEDPRAVPDADDPVMINEFTDEVWVSEMTRRWLRDLVAEVERRAATPDLNPDEAVVTR